MNGILARARNKHPAIPRDDHVVGTEVDIEIAQTPILFCVDDANGATSPIAHVKMNAVGAHHARVRVFANADGGFEMEIFGIENENFVGGFVADVDFARARMNGEAGEEGLAKGENRFVGFGEGGGSFVVVKNVNFAGRAAGNVNLVAVFAEGEAVPAGFQREELGNAMRRRIKNRQAGVVKTAAAREQSRAVGRENKLQRHVADRNGLAGGRDAPAVEQEIFVRGEVLFLANDGGIDGVGGGASDVGFGSIGRCADETGQENGFHRFRTIHSVTEDAGGSTVTRGT